MSSNPDAQRIAELEARLSESEQFAGTVAHELHGPLATLHGFAVRLESAAQSGDWDGLRRDVARIQQLTQDLRELVDLLLRQARSGGDLVAESVVSLRDAAQQAVECLGEVTGRPPVEIEISSHLPNVPGHRLLWRRVFQNLIANAIQATAGVAAPKIEIGADLHGDETACFVRDNGIGITAEQLADFFQRPGPGLGLPFVKRIVERQGAKLWVESSGIGRGTTVWWIAPASEPEA